MTATHQVTNSLTTGQVAKYCGVNYRTVIRWIERGEMKAYQLPGRGDNRIEIEDLIAFLRKNQMPIPLELSGGLSRVLVVESDRTQAQSLSQSLTSGGYEVQVAQFGFHAGAQIDSYRPALIIFDLQTPGLGGIEAVHYLRGNSRTKHLKVLLISDNANEDQHALLDAGANAVIQKPFQPHDLLAKVGQLVGKPNE
ncbi:Response regulator MprA [Poriferisphaera corsica]|uniref:Response regulator MprA n=1 Tax=Poriferisphaera corsica TaxID=2528020 RepID=A0A517YYR0_9BACT|nr:response regulator [Poriferisphaera corsica]QDU35358.1 Response regulator MprA [Poriferisphaera corsica]